MLGLKLREEFQGRRLKGTAIELANENNTGATQVSAAEFLNITYPTADVLAALEAIGPGYGRPAVLIGERGPGARVGELDEEMVFESRVGETFLLGASTWRIEEITHDRVLVSPAPGEPGKMPFWKADAAGRPLELDAIYQAPLERARRGGVAMPRTEALWRQLSFVDRRGRGGTPGATSS